MARYKKWQWIGTGLILFVLIGYFIYTHWIDVIPYYAVKYDPEMQYFLNSLTLFKGKSYAYIDHPGTPLEVIGSLLLALTRPITRGQGELFLPFHLANPQIFTMIAHGLVTVLSFATVITLIQKSWVVRGWESLIACLSLGVTYFAVYSPLTFRTLDWWTHNAFNLAFGTLLMLIVVLRLRRSEQLQNLEIIFTGLMAGILVCVQLYFVAWAAGIGLALVLFTAFEARNLLAVARTAVLSAFGMAVGFFVGFAPVLHRFRSFYLWVQRLISHQGRYGNGPEGVTTPGLFLDNLRWLWNRGEIVFLVSIFAFALLVYAMYRKRGEISRDPGWWAASIGIITQFVFLWILIGKHPGVNYLISVAALLPLILLMALKPLIEQGYSNLWIPGGTGILLVGLFFASLFTAVNDHRTWLKQVKEAEKVVNQNIAEIAAGQNKAREQLVVLWGYGVPSRCYSLRFANAFTEGYALREEINAICPNEWMYDVWGGYVELPTAYEPLQENQEWDIVVLPETYLPEGSERYANVIITDVQTRGYGRIIILEAK